MQSCPFPEELHRLEAVWPQRRGASQLPLNRGALKAPPVFASVFNVSMRLSRNGGAGGPLWFFRAQGKLKGTGSFLEMFFR